MKQSGKASGKAVGISYVGNPLCSSYNVYNA